MDKKLIERLYGELLVAYECSADEKMNFVAFPVGLASRLGYTVDESKKIFSLWDLVSENELEKRRQMLTTQLQTNEIEIVLPLTKSDGNTEWFLNRGHKFDTTVIGMLVPMSRIKDIFDRQSSELDMYKTYLEKTKSMVGTLQLRAEQDSLTKLYNADTTKSLCAEYLSKSGQMCAMIIFDLDGFKQVNDILGHIEGDRVLAQVAKKVQTLFRSGDIIGRIGGDEFLVLMKDIQSLDIIDKKCIALVDVISNSIDCIESIDFGCSVGAVVACTGVNSYEELFCCADRAMYSVKNNGKKDYCIRQMI